MDRIPWIGLLLYGGAAAGLIVLHLATSATLGFHTDELYYLACGRHLAFGYVDFPPLVPVLARVETGFLGVTPWSLRVLPCLVSGVLVGLSGGYVRRLGGSLMLQGLALVTAAGAVFMVGSNWVFQTVTFDQLAWMVALYWFLCLVVDRRPRYWIYLGITLGIGLEVKFTIVGLILGVVVALLLTPSLRAHLRTRYPWIAAAIAILTWGPNLAWQVAEGFPTLQYIVNHGGSGGGPLTYLAEFFLYCFFLLPLWVTGMISLFREREQRAIGIACAVPLLLFLFGGKSYYAMPTVPIVAARGLMALSGMRRPTLRARLSVAVGVAAVMDLVIFSPLTLPITPASRLHATKLDALNEVFADSVGWDDIANQVTRIYMDLPASERANTFVVSAYVGVPGALETFGDPKTRPQAVSPQLSDWYWLPNNLSANEAIMVDYKPAEVAWMCTSPTLITHLTVPYEVKGLEQGAPVTLCHLHDPIARDWPRLRNFS